MASRNSLLEPLGYDVLHMVLQLLSRADLCSLCLVSKPSSLMTEPYLYSTLEWEWDDGEEPFPSIISFLRTILSRIELADHLRKVRLLGTTYWGGSVHDESLGKFPTDE